MSYVSTENMSTTPETRRDLDQIKNLESCSMKPTSSSLPDQQSGINFPNSSSSKAANAHNVAGYKSNETDLVKVIDDWENTSNNSTKKSETEPESGEKSSSQMASSHDQSDVIALNINPTVLVNLEEDCTKLVKSVDLMLTELTKKMNKISAISVANTQACSDVVDDLSTCVDGAIHYMYSLMAQCEELDKAMLPVYKLANKIQKIKDIVTALEARIH